MDITGNIEKVGHEVGSRFRDRAAQLSGKEGKVTRKIEGVTSLLPSSAWMILAGASIIGSLTLKILGRDANANFVGQWAPMFLLIGVYNKLVKVGGSERLPTATPP